VVIIEQLRSVVDRMGLWTAQLNWLQKELDSNPLREIRKSFEHNYVMPTGLQPPAQAWRSPGDYAA
jgi:hypothetical protein